MVRNATTIPLTDLLSLVVKGNYNCLFTPG